MQAYDKHMYGKHMCRSVDFLVALSNALGSHARTIYSCQHIDPVTPKVSILTTAHATRHFGETSDPGDFSLSPHLVLVLFLPS